MTSDRALLAEYAQRKDAEAFSELVRRYANLVYGTCLRILRNTHDAEDVAQECFLELGQNAGRITSSLPGWLHQLATSRSINAVRNAATRRRYERTSAKTNSGIEAPWEDIVPLVDKALEELPADMREALVLHYLQGKTQQAVAETMGVSQTTVWRYLERGTQELREQLRKMGVVAPAAVVVAGLGEQVATAVPESLTAGLGKMALAGVGNTAGTTGAAMGVFGTLVGKLAVATVIAIGGAVIYKEINLKKEAAEYVEKHLHRDAFQQWATKDREAAIQKAMGIAEKNKGTELGAKSLMMVAAAYAGQCQTTALGADGWDKAIAIYQRVIDEYPGTKQADQSKWLMAGCYGCMQRWPCCEMNQGKKAWDKAIAMYRDLYRTAKDPGSRCDALRRVAEIQCNRTGHWTEGLATYRQILEQFPLSPPKSPYMTTRTCGELFGTFLVDFDLAFFTFRGLIEHANAPEQAVRIREDFVRLAPPEETITFGTLVFLEQKLRRLGDAKRADEIKSKLGLCKTWMIVGPFTGQTVAQGPRARIEAKQLVAGEEQIEYASDADCALIATSYEPERDVLEGQFDPAKVYATADEKGNPLHLGWQETTQQTCERMMDTKGAVYGVTAAQSPTARSAELRIGMSGFARAWLNGKEVLRTNMICYCLPDQYKAQIQLQAGKNVLLVKFVQWDLAFSSKIRITDKHGWAMADVTYSAPKSAGR